MNLGAGQPASLPYGAELQWWYSYHSTQFLAPLPQAPFSPVCYHQPPPGNYPSPNHYPPPYYFVSPNPYPYSSTGNCPQLNSYPPPLTPNPYSAYAYQTYFIPTNQFIPPPHTTHEPTPNPQPCSVPLHLERGTDPEVPIVESSHASSQFSDARIDGFIESMNRLFDNCIAKCMKGIWVSEGSSPSVPTQTTKSQSSFVAAATIFPLVAEQPIVHSHLWKARCKQVTLKSTAPVGGVKKPRRLRLGTVAVRNTSKYQKQKPKLQYLIFETAQDLKVNQTLRSLVLPIQLDHSISTQSNHNNNSAAFGHVNGTDTNLSFMNMGCSTIDFVFGDKLTDVDVTHYNEKRKCYVTSVKQYEQGTNFNVKGSQCRALQLLDEISKPKGLCYAGRTVAGTSIRDKGGGLVQQPLELAIGVNNEEEKDGFEYVQNHSAPNIDIKGLSCLTGISNQRDFGQSSVTQYMDSCLNVHHVASCVKQNEGLILGENTRECYAPHLFGKMPRSESLCNAGCIKSAIISAQDKDGRTEQSSAGSSVGASVHSLCFSDESQRIDVHVLIDSDEEMITNEEWGGRESLKFASNVSAQLSDAREALDIAPGITVMDALKRVLRLPSICSKRFLTSKVDMCVTGLVAQQQTVGPLQIPLSDVGVIARIFTGLTGGACAIGEQPIKGLLDPKAMARLAVGEALTNLVWAKVTSLSDVKASGNWMYAAKLDGEGAAMYDAANALSDTMITLGIAIDGGKDSLSMAAHAGGEIVKAPGNLVISVYCTCPDITKTVTPDLKLGDDGVLLHLDLAAGKRRLGGSALAQVLDQIRNDCPDLEDVSYLKRVFGEVQCLLDHELISAGHDISDGGLLVCALEMAIAGNCGINLDLASHGKSLFQTIFSEELGLIIEVSKNNLDTVMGKLSNGGISAEVIGQVTATPSIELKVDGATHLNESTSFVRDMWEDTSFQLEKLQRLASCVDLEKEGLKDRHEPLWQLSFTPSFTDEKYMNTTCKPKLAVIREEGKLSVLSEKYQLESYSGDLVVTFGGKNVRSLTLGVKMVVRNWKTCHVLLIAACLSSEIIYDGDWNYNTACYIDEGGGKRNNAFAMYWESEHVDIIGNGINGGLMVDNEDVRAALVEHKNETMIGKDDGVDRDREFVIPPEKYVFVQLPLLVKKTSSTDCSPMFLYNWIGRACNALRT